MMDIRATLKKSLTVMGIAFVSLPAVGWAQSCENDREPKAYLGIGNFHCQGGTCRVRGAIATSRRLTLTDGQIMRLSETSRSSDEDFEFTVQPSVWEIDPEGPAASRLQDGDKILTVDGFSVTSVEAGRALGRMEPGTPVVIEVRRGPSIIRVDLMPELSCRGMAVSVGPNASPPSFSGFGVGQSLREAAAGADRTEVSRRAIALPPLEADLESAGTVVNVVSTGTLGIGIGCDDCSTVIRAGSSRWAFSSHPIVVSVTLGGPAGRAGLMPGDVLTYIDGLELTSQEGGARFGSVKAGDEVEIRFMRGDEERTATVVAVARRDR